MTCGIVAIPASGSYNLLVGASCRPQWAKDDEHDWRLVGEWWIAYGAEYEHRTSKGDVIMLADPLRMYWAGPPSESQRQPR